MFVAVVSFIVINMSEESKCIYFMGKSEQENAKHQAAGSKTGLTFSVGDNLLIFIAFIETSCLY